MTANMIVREKAKYHNVRLWQVADRLGMKDYQLSKKLRKELTTEEQRRVIEVIEDLAAAGKTE